MPIGSSPIIRSAARNDNQFKAPPPPRPYQRTLIEGAWKDLAAGKTEVVLAGAPSSGKTFMAWRLVERAVRAGQRVLILVHNQHFLKTQFAADAPANLDVVTIDGPGDVDEAEGHSVVVAIPSSVHRKSIGEFDLAVIDEAHAYYHPSVWNEDTDEDEKDLSGERGMVQAILKAAEVKQRLLLTGTPSVFVRRKLPLHAIALFDLFKLGHAADVQVELARSAFDFRAADYTATGNIKEAAAGRVTKKQAEATVGAMLEALVAHTSAFTGKGGDGPGRGIIFCRGTRMADRVGAELAVRGVSVIVSHSYNDPTSSAIDAFRHDDTIDVLVVSDRCRLGFNLPSLCWVADFTATRNVDLQFQMYCRLTRPHPQGRQKIYLKAAPAGLEGPLGAWLEAALNLGHDSLYRTYDGSQSVLNGGIVRKLPQPPRDQDEPGDDGEGKKRKPPAKRLGWPPKGFFFSGFMKDIENVKAGALTTVAMTTLGQARVAMGEIDKSRLTWDDYIETGKKFGYRPADPSGPVPYSLEKSEWICVAKGHRTMRTYADVRAGHSCGRCPGGRYTTWEDREADAAEVGLVPVHAPDDPVPTTGTPWPYRCLAAGHVTKKVHSSVKAGSTCGECSGNVGHTHEKHAAAIAKHGKAEYIWDAKSPVPKAHEHVRVRCLLCGKIGRSQLTCLKGGDGLGCCRFKRMAAAQGRPVISGDGLVFESANAAGRALGLSSAGNIHNCATGKRPTAHGLSWRYLTDQERATWERVGRPSRMPKPTKVVTLPTGFKIVVKRKAVA